MTMQVSVDLDRCQGHGKCMLTCPEVFEEDVQGYPVVLLPDVPEHLQSAARRSADDCPERAITVAS
jgi:ferredoxin